MHSDKYQELLIQQRNFKKKLQVIIGQEIKTLRKSKGISGYELGDIIRMSQQQISRYECGDSAIQIDTLILILRLFNISPEKFIHRILFLVNRDIESGKLLSVMSNHFHIYSDSNYLETFEQYKHN
ncbi:helix-turn-helix domain-containing protein [Morganella morganii]|uniref:helix-turn-helix domain-containing protein n=1 Tax=Morganella morganii TaxID=582 RepID=UPI003F299948